MDTRGSHITADFWGCEAHKLVYTTNIVANFVQAAVDSGATVLHHYFHEFEDGSVSGFVLLAESHLSIHTWPDKGYAALDFYTCGSADPQRALRHMELYLTPTRRRVHSVPRGEPING